MIKRRFFVLFVLGGLVHASLGAQSSFPPLEPDSRAPVYARRINSGSYTWEDLAEISLWASGGEISSSLMNTLRAAVAEITPALPADSRERGDFILSYMHRKFLKSYSALQTRVDTILTNGRYNCVSSAALFTILAHSAGLDVQGVLTRDHAFARVRIGAEIIDVETTNPYGFDPGNRKEFHDNFGTLTGFAYVPARNYRDRADISRIELISLIFTNRISELESRGRYEEAIPLAANRAALLADRGEPAGSPLFPDPLGYLTDRLFNYGASLIQRGRETEALQWAALAEARYPEESRWQEFVYTALNNLLVKHIRGGRISEAREALDTNASRLNTENHRRLEAQLLDAELVRLSGGVRTSADAEAGLVTLKDAEARSLLPDSRIEELRTFLILKAGELRSAEAGWGAAIAYTEALAAQHGRNRKVEEQLGIFRSNRVAELHNAFAAAYNRRNYDEARRIIGEALEEFPGNRQLVQDRDMLEKTAAGR